LKIERYRLCLYMNALYTSDEDGRGYPGIVIDVLPRRAGSVEEKEAQIVEAFRAKAFNLERLGDRAS
jgi:hypothetical protein